MLLGRGATRIGNVGVGVGNRVGDSVGDDARDGMTVAAVGPVGVNVGTTACVPREQEVKRTIEKENVNRKFSRIK